MRFPHGLPAFALIALAALPLCAQQSGQPWPPDDDFTGVQPQPIPSYSPTGQYGSAPQDPQGNSQQAWADVPQSPAQQSYAQQPLTPDQLSQLIAPIALYPDALIAQILAASTYPAQVAAADRWLQYSWATRRRSKLPPKPTRKPAGIPPSRPSLHFRRCFFHAQHSNLQWTTQPRQRVLQPATGRPADHPGHAPARPEAGNLQNAAGTTHSRTRATSTSRPPIPQVVYVPTYNPWAVYGAPVDPYPGFSCSCRRCRLLLWFISRSIWP